MKALFFTLLLLLIAIPPSFTAPPPRFIPPSVRGRQRIIYTVFTTSGVFHVELLWAPASRRLVYGNYRFMVIEPPEMETTRVTIERRAVIRFTFDRNAPNRPPEDETKFISAVIRFTPPQWYHGPDVRLPDGSLTPGIFVMNPSIVTLGRVLYSNIPLQCGRWTRVYNDGGAYIVNFVIMTILFPNDIDIDTPTQHAIQAQGLAAYLQQSARYSSNQHPQLPLQLNAGTWIRLLANRLSDPDPVAVECEPEPQFPQNLGSRRHPGDTCRVSTWMATFLTQIITQTTNVRQLKK
jgi:hypothetical protein